MLISGLKSNPSLAILIVFLTAVGRSLALDAAGWKRQSIYQLLTDRFARSDDVLAPCDLIARDYCGGTWRGIIEKLDYIQGMGFTAIWISPVIENLEKGYHGYFGLNQNKLNPHFGTTQDLKDLSSALHQRGMYLMIDVVANHVGSTLKGSEFFSSLQQYSSLSTHHYDGTTTSNPSPASPYGFFSQPHHFHEHCYITDWNNQTQVEDCWLGPFHEHDFVLESSSDGVDGHGDNHNHDHGGGETREKLELEFSLADLNTQDEGVKEEMYRWIRWLVREFEVDGLRLDTVKHVNRDFWPGFVQAAGVFCIGEVYHGDPDYVVPYQWTTLESLFNFPTYFPLTRAFTSPQGDMFELTNMILTMQAKAKDVSLMGTFTDNHDVKRFSHYTSDPSLRLNAFAFPFVSDGFPVTYSGSEHALEGHEDPFNREATWLHGYRDDMPHYKAFAKLNRARQMAMAINPSFADIVAIPLVTSEHELVLYRAPLISAFSNRGANSGMSLILVNVPGLETGSMLTDLLAGNDAPEVMVGHGGNVRIEIYDGRPRILVSSKMLKAAKEPIRAPITRPIQSDITDVTSYGTAGKEDPSIKPPTHSRKSSAFQALRAALGGGKSHAMGFDMNATDWQQSGLQVLSLGSDGLRGSSEL